MTDALERMRERSRLELTLEGRTSVSPGWMAVPRDEWDALLAVAQAAQAYIDKYDSEPRFVTADLNPYSMRGRRETLRAALKDMAPEVRPLSSGAKPEGAGASTPASGAAALSVDREATE